MAQYRISRNTEASMIDFLTEQLSSDGWSGIRVEKSFSEVYKGSLPCICVNVSNRSDTRREIGSDELNNYLTVDCRIFATTDGLRLDLADWLLEKIMSGINYYEYRITDGQVTEKNLAGKIVVLAITDNRKELKNVEVLAKEDKYRHIISFRARIAKST